VVSVTKWFGFCITPHKPVPGNRSYLFCSCTDPSWGYNESPRLSGKCSAAKSSFRGITDAAGHVVTFKPETLLTSVMTFDSRPIVNVRLNSAISGCLCPSSGRRRFAGCRQSAPASVVDSVNRFCNIYVETWSANGQLPISHVRQEQVFFAVIC